VEVYGARDVFYLAYVLPLSCTSGMDGGEAAGDQRFVGYYDNKYEVEYVFIFPGDEGAKLRGVSLSVSE